MSEHMLLDLAKKELTEMGALDGSKNKAMVHLANILDDEIPSTMREALANYAISSFINQFHIKIELSPDNLIPCNVINFILAHSGAKKTSSVNFLESALDGGYRKIDEIRQILWKAECKALGEELPKPAPLFATVSTEAGMIQRLNDFKKEGLGCPALFVDEISTELATSPDIIPNIKLTSQLFDSGNAKAKVLKDRTNQSEEVEGMGMCALFIGSEHGILEDKDILKMFEDEFVSKLARRCSFVYPVFDLEKITVENYGEHRKRRRNTKTDKSENKEAISKHSKQVAKFFIEEDVINLGFPEEVADLHEVYSDYCEERAKDIAFDTAALEQKHRPWKVLKLAGAYSAFSMKKEVTVEAYFNAITHAEEIAGDLTKFIQKASREPHEILVDHMIEKGTPMSIHDLVKKKLIKKTDDIQDLVALANSKATFKGNITVEGSEVIGEAFQSADTFMVSVNETTNFDEMFQAGLDAYPEKTEKEIKRAVKERFSQLYSIENYSVEEYDFEKSKKLLSGNYCFCPFEYKGNKRGRDNVVGGTSLIVLDIDDCGIDIESAQSMLADYSYHIARSSDENNPMKYRVLLKSDIVIDLKEEEYKDLYEKIANVLGFEVDVVPKSQYFFGYEGREVHSNVGIDLEVSTIIQNAKSMTVPTNVKASSKAGLEGIWKNRRKFFHYAYDIARGGEGIHRKLYMLMQHGKNVGFSYERNIELLDDAMASCDATREGFVDDINRQRKRLYQEG